MKTEKHVVNSLTFIREQDGIPERELKSRWIRWLAEEPAICRAYLSVASYDDRPSEFVGLFIVGAISPNHHIRDALAKAFSGMFNAAASLDIVFITDEQEEALRRACRPFYVHGVYSPV